MGLTRCIVHAQAHFPDTGRRFADGVQRYLRDGHATKIKFPPHGALVILGRLDE